MVVKWLKKAWFTFVGIGLLVSLCIAQDIQDERLIGVSLRMIGHQVLINSGDSTSRVLPIAKESDRYRIQFESDFAFNPEELVTTIDSIIRETRIANAYIVEVEKCETGEVVYSYHMKDLEQTNIVHCQSRIQPKSSYNLLFTLMEHSEHMTALGNEATVIQDGSFTQTIQSFTILSIILLLIAGVFFYLRRQKHNSMVDPNVIPLGDYQFDKRNTELKFEDRRIELTGKEADLLILLYDAVNTTVEREVILKMVWGDEGDYVGRTLDVFISRLRKKLEADSSVKIVNIRGIGYKLVANV